MSIVDEFCKTTLEEAKRFYEKAKVESDQDGKDAYLKAAILLGFAALESHINAIADDFLTRSDLSVLEQSILSERDFDLHEGKYRLTGNLKMYRLEDRIRFIYRRFSGRPIKEDAQWWGDLKGGITYRNKLTHPKEVITISEGMAKKSLEAIINTLNALYKAVYKKACPSVQRGLISNMSF